MNRLTRNSLKVFREPCWWLFYLLRRVVGMSAANPNTSGRTGRTYKGGLPHSLIDGWHLDNGNKKGEFLSIRVHGVIVA